MALNADALTSVESCRRTLRLKAGVDTNELEDAINAYSRAGRHFTGREFAPRTPANDADSDVERILPWNGEGSVSLEPYEARSISAVRLHVGLSSPVAVPTSDWRGGPRSRTDEGTFLWLAIYDFAELDVPTPVSPQRLPPGSYDVGVVGRWGAGPRYGETGSMVPPDVELACRIAVANAYRNPEGFASRTIGELDVTEETVPLDEAHPGLSLPRDSRNLLRPYQRPKARMRYRTAGITA